MKTWTHVKLFLDNRSLPYQVDGEMLRNLDGRAVACTVQGVRDYFASPGHPDSKRQARRKQRDCARYGGRRLKEASVTSCPVQRTRKRREVREMRRRLEAERKEFARTVAARLLGGKRAA